MNISRIIFFYFLVSFIQVSAQSEIVDYSQKSNWAVLPGLYPKGLEKFGSKSINDSIDVFYIYPTLITSKEDLRWNVPIDDSIQHQKITEGAICFQASAWSEAGNIYAPYYRQAHIRSYYNLENGGREALLLAYSDVKSAFQYYLNHYNKGKGIILAGHSQGSTHLAFILHDFFDGKPLQNKLVAAYLPGIGFEKDLFKTLPFMYSPDQIGGFISWNTFKRKVDQEKYKWYKNKAVINPVTWDTTKIARRSQHQGFLFSNGKMYSHSFETHIGNGIIWISTPHFPYRYLTFTMDSYHVGDVNLFWEDIRLNALLRSRKYLELRNMANE